VLRKDAGSLGLVTANGGYVTKHALGLYSTEPLGSPFVADDVQAIVDEVPTTPADESFTGEGAIEAATVMHDGNGPSKGLAAIRTPEGGRTWASSTDTDIMTFLMSDDAVGASAIVDEDGQFSC
jgi:acetyl-CoA C-acetyltransferase